MWPLSTFLRHDGLATMMDYQKIVSSFAENIKLPHFSPRLTCTRGQCGRGFLVKDRTFPLLTCGRSGKPRSPQKNNRSDLGSNIIIVQCMGCGEHCARLLGTVRPWILTHLHSAMTGGLSSVVLCSFLSFLFFSVFISPANLL